MSLFAPVAPIQILEEMKKKMCLGNYHLLLAHHVLEEPERFKALFEGHQRSTIIMDNSLVELGSSANEEKVLEACQVIQSVPGNPHWIVPVLTDVMGDGKATRESAAASYTWWKENAPLWPLMVVLQGKDWKDYIDTVDFFLADNSKFPGLEYAGVPRVLVEKLGGRFWAIQYLDAVRPDINTHLLGFSDNVADDIVCANLPTIEGIDSAVPLRYAFSASDEGNDLLYTPSKSIPPRPENWFTDGSFGDADFTNLMNIRKWVT